jgi:hypothetical protein
METALFQLELVPRPRESRLRQQLYEFGGMGTPLSNGHYVLGMFRDPNAESAQILARTVQTVVDGDTGREKISDAVWASVSTAQAKGDAETDYYLMLDEVTDPPTDPDLAKKATIRILPEALQAIQENLNTLGSAARTRLLYQLAQKAIADGASLDVISDSFAVMLGGFMPGGDEAELRKTLDEFAQAYVCNYEKHGSVIEIRRSDWFRRRSSQIPDEWVQSWRDELTKTGTLSLERYAQMATLTHEQNEENIDSDPVLSAALGVWYRALNNEGLLRFYLRLDSAQRSAILAQDGLNTHALTSAQWEAYSQMFGYGSRWAWDTEVFSDPASTATIKATAGTGADGHVEYEFVVTAETSAGPRTDSWHVNLPKINPPVDTKK